MGVQIDEAGRHELPLGVDDFLRLMGLQVAELGDLPVPDSDIGAIAWQPSAIDHRAPSDDYIKFRHSYLLMPAIEPAVSLIFVESSYQSSVTPWALTVS